MNRVRMAIIVTLLAGGLGASLSRFATPSVREAAAIARLSSLGARLPLAFEPNVGQIARPAAFVARTWRASVFLSGQGASVLFPGRYPFAVRFSWPGARPEPPIIPGERLAGTVNYLTAGYGRTRIPTYRTVRFKSIYPGIDVQFSGAGGQLEYDWLVRPHADPGVIAMRVAGMPSRLGSGGSLRIGRGVAALRQEAPRAYQQIGARRRWIDASYVPAGSDTFKLRLGRYDRSRPLVIDPSVVFSTLMDVAPAGVGTDGAGNIYVAGLADLDAYPRSGHIGSGTGPASAVVKLDPTGQTVLSTTYIGGRDAAASALAVGHDGTAYLAGSVLSSRLPVVAAAQPKFGGRQDAFVLALAPAGDRLVYSTFLGGSDYDYASAIAVDPSGAVAVVGVTASRNFPTVHPLQRHNKASGQSGGMTGFVARLDPGGRIIFSTYLGGAGGDQALAVATDASGDVFAGGWTQSTDFPLVNPLQASVSGVASGFMVKINPTGDRVIFGTRYGDFGDRVTAIAVDPEENIYMAGVVGNPENFPTRAAVQAQFGGGGEDGFAAKIAASGQQLVYSTFLGGNSLDGATAITVDAAGEAYVAGNTASPDFPVASAVQPRLAGSGTCSADGCSNAFVIKLAPGGGSLLYSTYLGGSQGDGARAVAVTPGGVLVVGAASSTNFPVAHPLQSFLDPNQLGGFAAKILDSPAQVVPLATRAPVPTPTPAPVPCPAGLQPTALSVRRDPAFPADFLSNAGPLRQSISGNANVLALYQTVCALPPGGPHAHCPIDYGALYTLSFVRVGGTLLTVTADPGGCRWLTIDEAGAAGTVVYSTSESFWMKLAAVLGVAESSLFPATTPIGNITGETFSRHIGIALGLDLRNPGRNAVVQGKILVENRSSGAVTILSSCSHGDPWAQVRDGAGQLVDPPAVPQLGELSCASTALTVPAQQYIYRPVYVLLRGRRLAAFATVQGGGHDFTVGTSEITLAAPSSYTARPALPARITLHTAGAVSADVTKPAGATGPLLFTESFACPGGASGWRDWDHSAALRLTPPCAHPSAWHLVAGWLNHPVADVTYVRPGIVR